MVGEFMNSSEFTVPYQARAAAVFSVQFSVKGGTVETIPSRKRLSDQLLPLAFRANLRVPPSARPRVSVSPRLRVPPSHRSPVPKRERGAYPAM